MGRHLLEVGRVEWRGLAFLTEKGKQGRTVLGVSRRRSGVLSLSEVKCSRTGGRGTGGCSWWVGHE